MVVRQLKIAHFRGIHSVKLYPGARTVLIGPNNSAKSTLLEALDVALHPGLGRPPTAPDELDYYARATPQQASKSKWLSAISRTRLPPRSEITSKDGTRRSVRSLRILTPRARKRLCGSGR